MKNDILIPAVKTFIMAFLGVFIPELCIFLHSDFPVNVNAAAMVFSSMFCAALASGLMAAWNFVENKLSKPAQKIESPEDIVFGDIVE